MFKLRDKDQALVEFLDKAIFKFGINTRSPQVRRPTGKPYESQYLKPTFKSKYLFIGIQGVILLYFYSNLIILPRGTRINLVKYSRSLSKGALPLYKKITKKYRGAIFRQDIVGYYTSKAATQYLKDLLMQVIKQPT